MMTMSDTLPSNVSIISTEMVETRKMMAGVQMLSTPSSDDGVIDVVANVWSASLAFAVHLHDRITTLTEKHFAEQSQ